MARLPKLKSDATIKEELRVRLETQGGISHWAYDSIGNLVADTVSTEFARTHAQVRDVFKSLQLTHAINRDLDFIAGEWTGNVVQRQSPTTARVSYGERNFFFYTEVGTFGTLNGGEDITIPAGTVISTEKKLGKDSIIYRTDKAYTLKKDSNMGYCSLVATTMGRGMNCGKNTLIYHQVSYKEQQKNLLKCRNRFPVLNGSDGEDDEDLRYRITQAYPSVTQNNLSKIRLLGLGVPGIENLRVIDGYYGIGTVGVIAVGMDNETSTALVDSLQTQLSGIQSIGLKIIASKGMRVRFDFDIRCMTKEELGLAEQNLVEAKIKKELFSIMKDMENTRTFNFKSIGAQLLSACPEVLAFKGIPGKLDYFQHAYYVKVGDESMLNLPPLDRKEIIKNSFSIAKDEFIDVGIVTISFEVQI